MSEKEIVEVALGLPIDRLFHYTVPPELRKEVAIGKRVLVPFGRRRLLGYVVGFPIPNEVKRPEGLKEIAGIIDQEPVIIPQMLKLTMWMSEYYLASWGEALEAVLPGGMRGYTKPDTRYHPSLRSGYLVEGPRASARGKPDTRIRDQGSGIGNQGDRVRPKFAEEQKRALEVIKRSIDGNSAEVILLQGVRGSGKRYIYLEAIAYTLHKRKRAILLLPEISLAPQMVAKFKARFGERIGILHSKLSPGQRYDEWCKIKDGQVDIVVGVRSAVFAPLPNLSLIVIDQEHDTSYKEEGKPRYHARDVAGMRAEYEGATVILASAAPAIESYYSARMGKHKLVRLSRWNRDERALPPVKIVDMSKEPRRKGGQAILSQELQEAIEGRLGKGSKVVLFLNRRGFASFILCRRCGKVLRCPNCNLTLSFHYATRELKCHHCSYRKKAPGICPDCGSNYIGYLGVGTQKVEQELRRSFPRARILRLDVDTVKGKGSILDAFREDATDILVGTQLVIKGMDFPADTLLGIVSADTALNLPDFRASERTFQLIGEAVGWVGRGSPPCEVVLQTYLPDQHAISCACQGAYEAFYREELRNREELAYPPFSHLIKIVLRGTVQAQVMKTAQELARILARERQREGFDSITILGPIAAPLSKIRGKFRWQVFLKGADSDQLHSLMKSVLAKASSLLQMRTVHVDIDVDPVDML